MLFVILCHSLSREKMEHVSECFSVFKFSHALF